MLQNVGAQLLVAHVVRVLRRNHHRIHAHRLLVGVVLHRHLALAVGPQVRHQPALAHLTEPLRQLVRQRDRQRHQLRSLVRRIAEHHPLVARAARVHAHRNVARLLVDGRDHRAGIRIEAIERIVVADGSHRPAHQALEVHIRLGGDLTRNHHQPGAGQRLARHPAKRVLCQTRVQNRVRDLVGNLVRMSLGHGFTGKQCTVTLRQIITSMQI